VDKIISESSGATEAAATSARGGSADSARESLEAVCRDLNVPVHRLPQWRDRVPTAAESARRVRERDERDDEIALLQAKVCELLAIEVSTARMRIGQARSRSRRNQRVLAAVFDVRTRMKTHRVVRPMSTNRQRCDVSSVI